MAQRSINETSIYVQFCGEEFVLCEEVVGVSVYFEDFEMFWRSCKKEAQTGSTGIPRGGFPDDAVLDVDEDVITPSVQPQFLAT
jgi:hypothetical protein